MPCSISKSRYPEGIIAAVTTEVYMNDVQGVTVLQLLGFYEADCIDLGLQEW